MDETEHTDCDFEGFEWSGGKHWQRAHEAEESRRASLAMHYDTEMDWRNERLEGE